MSVRKSTSLPAKNGNCSSTGEQSLGNSPGFTNCSGFVEDFGFKLSELTIHDKLPSLEFQYNCIMTIKEVALQPRLVVTGQLKIFTSICSGTKNCKSLPIDDTLSSERAATPRVCLEPFIWASPKRALSKAVSAAKQPNCLVVCLFVFVIFCMTLQIDGLKNMHVYDTGHVSYVA